MRRAPTRTAHSHTAPSLCPIEARGNCRRPLESSSRPPPPPLPPFALHLSRRLPFVSRSHSHRSLSHCALALAHCDTRKLPPSSRVQLSRCRPLRLLAPHRAHPSPLLSQDPASTSRCTLAPSHRSARELLPPALALHKRAGPITQRFPTVHSHPPLLCRPVSLLALAL